MNRRAIHAGRLPASALLGTALAAGLLLTATPSYSQASMPDYEVKAAFLYHFTQFIEWPLPDSNSPFPICVANDPATSAALELLTRGKSVGSHPLTVVKLQAPWTQPCRMLFLAAGARQQSLLYLEAVGESGVLTVGEGPAFRELGGMVELFLDDHRIAFRLNVQAMQRAHLNASSRLLRLARQTESAVKAEGYH